jgi:hypothetical protein
LRPVESTSAARKQPSPFTRLTTDLNTSGNHQ